MRRKKQTAKIVFVFFLGFLAGTLVLANLIVGKHTNELNRPVTIPKGASVWNIADSLSEADVIPSSWLFVIAARVTGQSGKLQSGIYQFPPHFSALDAIDALAEGKWLLEKWITIREGATNRRIASMLRFSMGFDSAQVMDMLEDPRFIRSFNLRVESLEGYLRPNTYRFRVDMPLPKILSRLVREQLALFTEERRRRMLSLGLTMHEALTMASIVEGETRLDHERAKVAGVYYNRLKRNMLLQADPTIQYVIPNGPRRLLYKDLAFRSPYNTYIHPGLPPGPVNNPGEKAIDAALYPDKHHYYYFVADGNGGHVFSRSFSEHQSAVADYRRIQRGRME